MPKYFLVAQNEKNDKKKFLFIQTYFFQVGVLYKLSVICFKINHGKCHGTNLCKYASILDAK